MSFPEIRLVHDRQTISAKMDEFSGNQSESPPGKLKFRQNIWKGLKYPEV